MPNMNRVFLIGHLTRDPESPRQGIAKFGLAVNNRRKNSQTGEWGEVPCFVDVTAFQQQADHVLKYLKKGEAALVEGRLEMDTWDDKQSGQKRSKLHIVAERVSSLAPKGQGSQQQGGQRSNRDYQRPQPARATEGSEFDF